MTSVFQNLIEISETLKQVFIVFPTFALGRGLMDIVLTNTINEVNELLGASSTSVRKPRLCAPSRRLWPTVSTRSQV